MQGAVGQTSGESLAAGSAEQAKGALVNSSDSGAGGGQAAAGQGGLAAMPQANSNSPIPQSTDATPVMNSSAASSQQPADPSMADPSMADTGQSALQGMSPLQARTRNGVETLVQFSQNVGALLNTTDSRALQALSTGRLQLSRDQTTPPLVRPSQLISMADAEMDNISARTINQMRLISEDMATISNAMAHQEQMVMDLFKTTG